MSRRSLQWLAVLALIGSSLVMNHTAEAQSVVRRAKAEAKKRIADRKQAKEDSLVARTGDVVDSTVTRAERVLTAAVNPQSREARRIRGGLEDGRLVLDDVSFGEASAELAPGSEDQLAHVAAALSDVPGTFLVEVQVLPNAPADAKRAQLVATKRAAAIKAWLVAAGIPPSRLFATGSSTPRVPERVAIARVH